MSLILLYEGAYTTRFTFWDEVKILWKSTILSFVLLLLFLFTAKLSQRYSRTVILTFLLFTLIFFPIIRTKIKRILFRFNFFRGRLLIFGAEEDAIRFFRAIESEPNLGLKVVGFIDGSSKEKRIEGIKVRKPRKEMEKFLKRCAIDGVAISTKDKTQKEVRLLLDQMQKIFRKVYLIPELKGIPVMGTEFYYFFSGETFALEIKNNLQNPVLLLSKRIFDYVLSLIILPFILPLFLFIFILIKATSKGPAVFSQERIGKDGKIFKCYKFRTMYQDAELRLKEILEKDEEAKREWETSFKLKEDPRVTRIGKLLRKTSIDELPQIINVLKGEMSLVGPRPVTKEELERYYKEEKKFYFLVPPGITGLWQVSGRSNTTYEQRVAVDAWYVKNWNLWLDIVILLKTIKVALKGEGAY